MERICTIPLREAYETVRTKRMRKAAKIVREYVARHMKVELGDVRISGGLNHAFSEHGAAKPPRRVKVKIVKDDKGIATAWLLDEQEKNAALVKKLEEKKKMVEERNKKAQEAKAKQQPKASPAPKAPEAKQEAQKGAPAKAADAKPAEGKK